MTLEFIEARLVIQIRFFVCACGGGPFIFILMSHKQVLVVEDEAPPIFDAKPGPPTGSGTGTKSKGKDNPFSFFSFKKDGQPSDPASGTPTSTTGKKTKNTTSSTPAKPASRRISDLEPNIFDEVPSSTASTKKQAPSTKKPLRPPPPIGTTPSIFDDPEDPLFGNLPSSTGPARSERPPTAAKIPPVGLRGGISLEDKGSEMDFGIGDGSELDKELRKKKAKEEENPFSFKNFAKGKGVGAQEGDEKVRKEIGNSGGGSKAKTGEKEGKEEVEKGGENPFSFKAFAQKNSNGGSGASKAPSNTTTGDLALPVFEDDYDEAEEDGHEHLADLPEVRGVVGVVSVVETTLAVPLATAVALPNVVDDTSKSEKKLKRSGGSVGSGLVDEEARALRLQVEELQEKLRRSEAMAAEEAARAKQQERRAVVAEKGIARLKKKEEVETQQLNSIVQAVERNLLLATARAEKAEQRIKQLEMELLQARQSNQGGVGGGGGVGMGSSPSMPMKGEAETVKEQTAFAMSELHRAANEAEEGVKKLMGGVNTLREIAAALSSVQKISLHTDS